MSNRERQRWKQREAQNWRTGEKRNRPQRTGVGPPRIRLNKVLLSGPVLHFPRHHFFKPREDESKLSGVAFFKMMGFCGRTRKAFITCVGYHAVAEYIMDNLKKGDWVAVEGSLFWRNFLGSDGVTMRHFTAIQLSAVHRIPYREDKYYREETIPVPKEEYRELLEAAARNSPISSEMLDATVGFGDVLNAEPFSSAELCALQELTADAVHMYNSADDDEDRAREAQNRGGAREDPRPPTEAPATDADSAGADSVDG